MKDERQNQILDIIAGEEIDTQELLLERLRQRGIVCTQATISRDMKQLHLIKEPVGQGRYRYAQAVRRGGLNLAEKLRTILRESVLSLDCAQSLVVVKTLPGLANGAGAAIDAMEAPELVGTIAGDDTVLLVLRDAPTAEAFCGELREAIRSR